MAKSTSQSHANLIREMARETSRSSRSSQRSQASPSPQPTMSDFDPENEAIISTQQLDNNAQQLPSLRASAQKYNCFSRQSRSEPPVHSEPDYAINTSAIGRAFPDFSQGGTSSDEGSMSIEIGRGAKKINIDAVPNRRLSKEYSSNAQLDLEEDSLDFAAPTTGDHVVTGTPPLWQHQPSVKTTENSRPSTQQSRRPSGLRREIIEASSPNAKIKDYGSGESGKGSGNHGRTLAAIHARVRDANDKSHVNDHRPPTIDLTIRNTRFAKTKSHQDPSAGRALPGKFSSTKGLVIGSSSGRKSRSPNPSTTNQGTQQSFLIPDMPNMSELVSGVFEDGTPVFSRHGKSRPSRFVKSRGHADLDEIPIPEDEQAIFLSLKLLQDKIAILEKSQVEKEEAIRDLEKKNQSLELERIQQRKRASHRSDSALGHSESDGEERKLTIEKNRKSSLYNNRYSPLILVGLESSVHILQGQLDASNRKATTAETILRTITQERDSAVSQLSMAYITIKQLETENEDLREENGVLRDPVQHRSGEPENTIRKPRESTDTHNGQTTAPQASTLQNSPPKTTRFAKRSSRHAGASKGTNAQDLDIFDLAPKPKGTINKPGTTIQQVREQDLEKREPSIYEAPRTRGDEKFAANPMSSRGAQALNEDSSRDVTYLSFLDSNEIAKLRRTLEQERVERKERMTLKRQSSRGEAINNEQTQAYGFTGEREEPLPRKSSMRDLTSRSVREIDEQDAKGISEHNRRHSETSILSTHSRRRAMNADNMTSAFIVPDITIRANTISTQGVPEMSKENKEVLEDLAQHDRGNCTVCKSNPNLNGPHNHTVTIPKPIPVSERVPVPGSYEEEPTIRPSQAPGLALATVIKSLQDEIAHLKIQLAKYQALHNGHDPALSKRKRKSVHGKIESLLQTIDVKSDQVYALYDVLEGQKQDGREISEQEVEITLQSVGINSAGLHLRGGGAKEDEKPKGQSVGRRPWELSSEDEDDDLPWEGIESTVETTKSGFAHANRKSAAT